MDGLSIQDFEQLNKALLHVTVHVDMTVVTAHYVVCKQLIVILIIPVLWHIYQSLCYFMLTMECCYRLTLHNTIHGTGGNETVYYQMLSRECNTIHEL